MFNMGLTEILVIGAIALVIFGPEKLPKMARSLGKFITEAKRTVNGVKSTIQDEIDKNIGDDLKEVNNFRNSVNGNFRGQSVENLLTSAADALENSKPQSGKDERQEEENMDASENKPTP